MSRVLMRAIDLETGGMDPPACVIEIGWTDIMFDTESKVCLVSNPSSLLFQATHDLPADNIAVHHLMPSRLAGWPACGPADLRLVATSETPAFLVAANADFERKWITDDMIGDAKWICTVKAVARLYPDAPSHSNQAMRYQLGLELPEQHAMPPHRAGPDSFVTAHVLAHMLRTERVRDLVNWTAQPRFLPRCPIGKHKGASWDAIPADYLQWIQRTPDLDPDVKHAANLEMARRRGEPA